MNDPPARGGEFIPIFMFDTNIIIDISTKCFANSEMHEFVIESTYL